MRHDERMHQTDLKSRMSPLLCHLGLFECLGNLFLHQARLLHPLARLEEDRMVAEFSGYRWPQFYGATSNRGRSLTRQSESCDRAPSWRYSPPSVPWRTLVV